jgi:hypothetical protein
LNPESPAARTLQRALESVGSQERLATVLAVDQEQLARWMSGAASPPHEIFLRALDLEFQDTLPLAEQITQKKL